MHFKGYFYNIKQQIGIGENGFKENKQTNHYSLVWVLQTIEYTCNKCQYRLAIHNSRVNVNNTFLWKMVLPYTCISLIFKGIILLIDCHSFNQNTSHGKTKPLLEVCDQVGQNTLLSFSH